MSKSKYTLEILQAEANKYNARNDFKKKSPRHYIAASALGIIPDITAHMPAGQTEAYTDQELAEEAKKYSSKYDFRIKSPRQYSVAYKRGILDQILSHARLEKPKPKKKWTLDFIKEKAAKYDYKIEFLKNEPELYACAYVRGCLDEVCSHMKSRRGKPVYWTQERVAKEALKFKNISDFTKHSGSACGSARRQGFFKDVSGHMKGSGGSSKPEVDLLNEIKSVYPKSQKLIDRKVKIEGKPHVQGFELDIYVPELRKAIEFDGTYWHSVAGLKRSRDNWPEQDIINYHDIKDSYFESKGIKVYHVKEKDWTKDKSSCIEQVMSFLNES